MKSKLFILLFAILLISSISAYSKSYDPTSKTMKIYNNGGTEIIDIQLIDNTRYCSYECEATLKWDILVDGLSAPVSTPKIKRFILGNWVDDSLTISYEHNTTTGVWRSLSRSQFNTGIANSGTYYMKLKGTKSQPQDIYDWILPLFGELDLSEWAIWGDGTQVAYFKMDNSTLKEEVTEISGVNDGTVNASGIINSARDFELALDTNINYTDHFDVTATEMTINAWIKVESVTSTHWIVTKDSDIHGRGFSFGITPDGNISFQIDTQGSTAPESIPSIVGQWHMVSIVWDDTQNNATFYVDGNEAGSDTMTTSLSNVDANFLIGRREYSGAEQPFDGVIDEIGIWNRTLTASEITELYNDGNGLGFATTSSTVNITNEIYTNPIRSSTSNYFYVDVYYNSSQWSSISGSLVYDGSPYFATLNGTGDNVSFSKAITSPSVMVNTNFSFYWNISLTNATGSFAYQGDSFTQEVFQTNIGNCTTNQYNLFNFTFYDEDLSKNMSGKNNSAKFNIQLYDKTGSEILSTYTNELSNIDYFGVCLNENLSLGETYKIYGEVEYTANGFAQEFYYIQNDSITQANFTTDIGLYLLNSTINQPFKINYRDGNFLPVSNALIVIQRKYPESNTFIPIEIPKTDTHGDTLANLVLDDVIYKFLVYKNGVLLNTFEESRVLCQNPSINSCELQLNNFVGSIPLTDFENELDLSYSISYDRNTKTVSATFVVPSGTASTFILNVTREDAIGTFACTDTVISNDATLSCSVPSSIGNSTLSAKLYRNGDLVGQGTIKQGKLPSDIYGGVLVVLGLFIMLTLIGLGMSDNPVFTLLFLLVGVVLLFGLNLVANNGFIGATATILFLILSIIIVIIKGRNR